ncbi:DgyrCDS14171 [Dimorphilus gyrociliatus]|uniref:2'-phosphotransferase n=1 Tax=Dimorphilus gyrociliatus TaxID=2664684 RepID=A0A7I8WCZ6_9ANNE|nr:DgyrCDS14171 [Dimorphilus gyrociliatus]
MEEIQTLNSDSLDIDIANENRELIDRINKTSRKLTYLLRHGAVKEGLVIYGDGYVRLEDIMSLSLMKLTSWEDVKHTIKESTSFSGHRRFEEKIENDEMFVRASYGRYFERSPFHEGTKVIRLLERCLDYLLVNVQQYDFENFPDEYLINELIRRRKLKRRLNNKDLSSLLALTLEHLDLSGVYITEKTIKIILSKSPNIKFFSLDNCDFFLNDHFVERLLRGLPLLRNLNLANAKSLTDRSLYNISKYLKYINFLNIRGIENFTAEGLVHLVANNPNIDVIDAFSTKVFDEEHIDTFRLLLKNRKTCLICRGPSLEKVSITYQSEDQFNSDLS